MLFWFVAIIGLLAVLRWVIHRSLAAERVIEVRTPVDEAHAIYAARLGEHVHLKVVSGSHDDYTDLDLELPALVEFLSAAVMQPVR